VKRWEEAANNLRDACKNGVNILPPTIDAVKAYMTTGEITKIYMENS